MTEIVQYFRVMEPSKWMICHGPIHINFISWRQLHKLIIGQPDKMLRDLRNSKGSEDLSVTSLGILVSVENHNVSNLVFSLCMSECLATVRDTAMSLLHCSCRQHFLQRQKSPVGLSYLIVMQPSGGQYIRKSCSISRVA